MQNKDHVGKRHFILDFDHTLFNWNKFKTDLRARLIQDFKVSASKFDVIAEYIKASTGGLYNVYNHLSIIAGNYKLNNADLVSALNSMAKKAETYIYEDAAIFLDNITTNSDNVLTLITYGDRVNQKYFIEVTKVSKYFKNIIYVDKKEEKSIWFDKLTNISDLTPYIINDDPEEALYAVKLLAPGTRHILVERAGAKHQNIKQHDAYEIVNKLTDIHLE